MKKNGLLLICFAALTVSVFFMLAGCSREAEPDAETVTDFPAGPAPDENGGERTVPSGVSRTITLRLAADGGLTAWDPLAELVMEKLDFTVRPVPLPEEAVHYHEGLETLLASGDAPDLWRAALEPSRVRTWIKNGTVRDIPAEALDDYPLLAPLMWSDTALGAYRTLFGGGYWYAPVVNDRDPAYQSSRARIFYRKDLAEAAQIKTPATADEFYYMAAALTRRDEDGVRRGLAVEEEAVHFFAGMFGLDTERWIEEEGRYIPAYYSNAMLEPLAFARRLKDEGVMDFTGPDRSASLMDTPVVVAYGGGSLGFQAMLGPVAEAFGVSEAEAYVRYVGLTGIPAAPGRAALWRYENPSEGWFIRAGLSEARYQTALALFDYSLSDEARAYVRYGMPGVTYTRTSSGVYLFTDPDTNRAYDLPGLYPTRGFLDLITRDFNRDADPYLPGVPDFTAGPLLRILCAGSLQAYHRPYISDADALCRAVDAPLRDALAIEADRRIREIINQAEPLEEAFERFRADCRKQGLEEAIGEVNEIIALYLSSAPSLPQ